MSISVFLMSVIFLHTTKKHCRFAVSVLQSKFSPYPCLFLILVDSFLLIS